jgi:glycerol uptake facilitator-like aquaporin|tara:strand:+ start:284 stop:550 length:267 start_codon:yes stop_codon:yes gene_type:complete
MYIYLAEFIATLFFAYVVIATGNPLAIGASLALILLLSFRLDVVTVNPAITITLAAAGKIAPTEIIPICVVQVLGALVALEIYKRYNL